MINARAEKFKLFDVMQLKSLFNVQPRDCACFIYIGDSREGVAGQSLPASSSATLSSIVYHHLLLFSIATKKSNVIIIF